MNKRTKAIVVALIAVVVIGGGWALLKGGSNAAASIRYVTRPVAYADIAATVSETGTVNPVTVVQVGSEVSGTILTLSVDYNSIVRKGQVLATLDPTTFKASVDSAKANLSLTEATLNSSKVNVDKMKALLDLANETVKQDEPLAKQGLINENQIDTERTSALTAEQDYLSAQSAVKVSEAQVAVARGQLEQSQYSLSKTIITSPFDGIVEARNVSLGQTVASSLQTPTLFTIATNLTDMQVDTSVDEADVGYVRKGAKALLTVTAYPNHPFDGTVSQVRVNPTTVQNVVTYDAVVTVHDTSGQLLPGMTAQVNIEVGKKSHVLTVPIAALLYRPLAMQSQGQASAIGGGGGGGFGGAGVTQSSTGGSSGQAVAGAPGSQVTLWLLRGARPSPVQVVIGLSDGKNIEITSGSVAEDDQVVVAQYRGGRNRGQSTQSASPDKTSSTVPVGASPSTGAGSPTTPPTQTGSSSQNQASTNRTTKAHAWGKKKDATQDAKPEGGSPQPDTPAGALAGQ
jgi:HlyD family secretion protein